MVRKCQECDEISFKTRGGRKTPITPCRPLIVLLSSWPLCFNFPQQNQLSSSFRSKIPLLISFARKIAVLMHTASARYITINQSKFTTLRIINSHCCVFSVFIIYYLFFFLLVLIYCKMNLFARASQRFFFFFFSVFGNFILHCFILQVLQEKI